MWTIMIVLLHASLYNPSGEQTRWTCWMETHYQCSLTMTSILDKCLLKWDPT